MNIEKIEIKPNQYVWVDKDAEIKEGDYVYDTKDLAIRFVKKLLKDDWIVKIIAASPELNLEGVPNWVEWLGTQRAIERRWDPKSLETRKVANEIIEGVKFGYQTAEKELQVEQRVKDLEKRLYDCSKTNADLIGKINELPTWDDVIKAIWMARETEYGLIKSKDEIIEQLKQSKK